MTSKFAVLTDLKFSYRWVSFLLIDRVVTNGGPCLGSGVDYFYSSAVIKELVTKQKKFFRARFSGCKA